MARSSHSRLVQFSVGLGLVTVGAVAVVLQAQTAAQPKASIVAPTAVPAKPALAQDSTSAQGAPTRADSVQPSVTQREAPKPSGMWPVDPKTGMTLVNGEPVVGRVFILEKVDGLRKYEGVKSHYVGEPLPPEAPIVSARHIQPPPQAARRHRGMMVEATLWANERRHPIIERRHYRATTTADSLPRR